MFLATLAIRNLTRNTRRTLLTAATVLLGTGFLTLGLSWIIGVLGGAVANIAATAGEVRVVMPEYETREALMPLHHNIVDIAPVVEAVEAHGFEAHPVIKSGVTASVGEEIGEVFCQIVGGEASWLAEDLGLAERVVDGRMATVRGEAVVGLNLAEELGARAGDDIVFLGQTQDGSISPIQAELVGIVDAGNVVGNRQAFVPLSAMQWMADIPDGALEIFVETGDDVSSARMHAAALAADPALEPYVVQAWNDRDPYGTIYDVNQAILYVLSGAIVFITALGVLNTMMMSVLERTAEVGVLRAMGMKAHTVVSMFVIEAVCIGVGGSAAGVVLGAIPAWYAQSHGVTLGDDISSKVTIPMNTTFYADLSWDVVALSFCLGLLIAALGALLPSIRATAIQPVDAMRSRR